MEPASRGLVAVPGKRIERVFRICFHHPRGQARFDELVSAITIAPFRGGAAVRNRRSLLASIAIAGALFGALPASAQSEPTADAIRAIVAAARLEGLRWPRFPDYQHILVALYEPRGYAPLWLDAGRPTSQAREAIAVLRESDAKGLDPRDYDAEPPDRTAHVLGPDASAPERARFDAMLSVALLRDISDLHIGKVNPKHLAFGFDIDPKKYDLAAVVADAVREGKVREVVEQAEPHFAQ